MGMKLLTNQIKSVNTIIKESLPKYPAKYKSRWEKMHCNPLTDKLGAMPEKWNKCLVGGG